VVVINRCPTVLARNTVTARNNCTRRVPTPKLISTSLSSASCVSCQRGTARIRCCGPVLHAAPLLLGSNRSISPARRVLSCKPAARCCSGRSTGQTDRRTDGRTDETRSQRQAAGGRMPPHARSTHVLSLAGKQHRGRCLMPTIALVHDCILYAAYA